MIDLETLNAPAALIIDQFEEVFVSYENDGGEGIIARLLNLLDHAPHVTVILVMRDDFYSRLAQYGPMKRWIDSTMTSMPSIMQREEIEAIVREPVGMVGWQFQEGLVELIIKDVLNMPTRGFQKVARSTLLPLLEVALTQLWRDREEGMLTLKAYQNMGGVTASLTFKAEEVYTTFEEPLRPLVQHIFKALVYLGNPEQGVPDSRRRRSVSSLARPDDMSRDIDAIISQFVSERLLATSQRDQSQTGDQSQTVMVEIVHEALLWEWSRLHQWVHEDRPFLLWRQELERSRRAWAATNRRSSARGDPNKLLSGSVLTEAVEWAKKRMPDLSQDEREFIQISVKRARRRRITFATISAVILLVVLALSISPLLQVWHSFQPSVTTLSDSGPGSLRQALQNASPGSRITFDSSLRGTITLTSGNLDIVKSVTIVGPGANILAISGGTKGMRVHINPSKDMNVIVNVSGLAFKDTNLGVDTAGVAKAFVINEGKLTMTHCIVSGNVVKAALAVFGGGIFNLGTLTLNDSSISHNSISGSADVDGGGIASSGTLTLNNSTVSYNSVFAGPVYPIDFSTAYQGAQATAGGISNLGTLTLNNSAVSYNSTTSQKSNIGSSTANRQTPHDGISFGGGIVNA